MKRKYALLLLLCVMAIACVLSIVTYAAVTPISNVEISTSLTKVSWGSGGECKQNNGVV